MSRLFLELMGTLRRRSLSLKHQDFSRNTRQLARGNSGISAQIMGQQQTHFPPSSWNITLNGQNQIFRFPKHTRVMSKGMQAFLETRVQNIVGVYLPSLQPFHLNNKILENMIDMEQMPTSSIVSKTNNNNFVYLMGSLLKKRRRKMNRQKYKKRRNRDRFKRTALKNLREKKQQRKERAAARKQSFLSKMVVNKAISKRKARYLSHKLLPGVVKGETFAP